MADVTYYFELLKTELRKKFTIVPSITATSVLTKGDFEKIVKLILTETKSTLSVSTLQRIFKYNYAIRLDKRITKSLDILSRFLGYVSWDDFIEKKKVTVGAKGKDIEQMLVSIINNASRAEFDAYKAVPRIKTSELKKYFVTTGPAYKRIYNVLLRVKKRQWVINNKDNPSHRDIYEIKLLSMDSKTAIFEIVAYWCLRWHDVPTGKDKKIYNVANRQLARLVNVDGIWKILTNFYQPYNDKTIKKKGGKSSLRKKKKPATGKQQKSASNQILS